MVDQLRESLRVRLITDVQGGKPIEFAGGRAGTGLGHLGDAQIDAIGENGCEQQDLILRRLGRFQMREVLAEPCLVVHFQEQIGDLDVWK